MFRHFYRSLLLTFAGLFLLLTYVGCTGASKSEDPTVQASWLNRMHRISMAMTKLQPVASDQKEYFSESNGEMIQIQLNELAQTSEDLAKETSNAQDPILLQTARSFAQDMAFASNQFRDGNRQASQYVVNNMSTYCISCHTRIDRGTKDFPISWSFNPSTLSSRARTEYYLANRKYDAAIKEVQMAIKSPTVIKLDPEGWRQTIERTLAVAVRVGKSVAQTTSLVGDIVENKSIPSYIRRDATGWLKDAQSWKLDKPKKEMSDKQKYELAVRLVEEGKLRQTPQSHSAIVSSLRASELLHEILDNTSSKYYAEALYYAGMTSEQLRSLTVWSLNESYYEACIVARPHTVLAENCYAQLESSMNNRYSTFSGNPELIELQKNRLLNLFMRSERMRPPPPGSERIEGPML